MLKELWRKLGTELLHTNGTDSECIEGLPGAYGSAEFRILPHITHTGEFHLERLTSLLKDRYGMQPLSSETPRSDDAARELITFAARVQDQDIQRELLLFYLNCSPAIQEYLRSDGILGTSQLFPE